VIARLKMPAAAAVALEKALHIQEDVIRHMLIRGIMGSDEPPPEFLGSDRPRFAPRPPMGAEPRGEMRATAEVAPEGAPEAEPAVEAPSAPEVEAPPVAAEAAAVEAVASEEPAAETAAT
jgi:hypothetical protein